MLKKFRFDVTLEIEVDEQHADVVPEIMYDVQDMITRQGVTVLQVSPWAADLEPLPVE